MARTVVTASPGSVGPPSGFCVCASHPCVLGGSGEQRSSALTAQLLSPSAPAFGNGEPGRRVAVALVAHPDTMDEENYWRSTK